MGGGFVNLPSLINEDRSNYMKTLQRLEIFAGISTFLLILPNVFLTYSSFSEWMADGRISAEEILTNALLMGILPSFLLAIGAYLHIAKGSKVGLGMIVVFGGLLFITHLMGYLLGSVFNGHRLLGISPGIFAFSTILLALCNTLLGLKSDDTFS
jgi:hypothetical protein